MIRKQERLDCWKQQALIWQSGQRPEPKPEKEKQGEERTEKN